jgi:hypothetical protein
MIPILMTVHVVMDKQPNAGLIEASGGDPIGGGISHLALPQIVVPKRFSHDDNPANNSWRADMG